MLQQRARIMTDRIPTGSGMRAILGLETPTVEQFCAESSSDDEPCQIAIYSTHDRNVITGTLTAIEQCAQRCSESGAKVMPVRVARAFHSSLGRTAREEFGQVLETFAIDQPRLNVYYNYDGTPECDDIGAMLAGQLVKPVHLVETINSLLGDGYRPVSYTHLDVYKRQAMNIAVGSEKSRNFSETYNGISVGLSSGTSGHRGIFVISDRERSAWAGACLLYTSRCV